MKYLVRFTEDTHISRALSAPAILELVDRARPYFEDLKKKEKVVDYGFFGTGHGLYAVYNVRSTGELHELTELAPIRPICAIESQAVLDASEFAESFTRVRREVTMAWEKSNRQSHDSPTRY